MVLLSSKMARNLNLCFTSCRLKSISSPEHPLPESGSPTTPSAVLIKNFNSLFNAAATDHHASSSPDMATVFASRRFFFSPPGSSNSIIDSSAAAASSSVAVPTYSPDPFSDFRRSMQEMVEAREIHDVQQNWDYLHKLLMCYLSLNPKSTHKFIVGAFADLLVTLMTTPPPRRAGKPNISPLYL